MINMELNLGLKDNYIEKAMYSPDNNQIVFVTSDGSEIAVDCSTLVEANLIETQDTKEIMKKNAKCFANNQK